MALGVVQVSDKEFDPSRYLTKVGKNDYLQVMWRLVWFRERHPDGIIQTEMVEHRPGEYAVFKARVLPSVNQDGSSETRADFNDYLEKAETKAIGRALAALGFGTQFSAHEFGGEAEAGRIVDAPVAHQNAPGATGGQQTGDAPFPERNPGTSANHVREQQYASTRGRVLNDGSSATAGAPANPVTPRQVKFIEALAREFGIGDDELNAEVEQLYGRTVDQLDRRDASAYIERLQSHRKLTDLAS
jgi:hypothetical protein